MRNLPWTAEPRAAWMRSSSRYLYNVLVDTPTILAASLTVYNLGLFICRILRQVQDQLALTLQVFNSNDHCINSGQRLSTGRFGGDNFINLF